MFDVCATGDPAHIDTVFKRVCGKNLNLSSCQKKKTFSVFLWL